MMRSSILLLFVCGQCVAKRMDHKHAKVEMDAGWWSSDDESEPTQCCCKVGPCKGKEEQWDESMNYHLLENKCCKLRHECSEDTWRDWTPYKEKVDAKMCATKKDNCAKSWKGVHFDTLWNATTCDGSNCVAYELRQIDGVPFLTVHMGDFWAVKTNETTNKTVWKSFPVDANASRGTFVLRLTEMDYANLTEEGRLIIHKSGVDVLDLKNGLHHQEDLVSRGLGMINDWVRAVELNASKNASNESDASSFAEASQTQESSSEFLITGAVAAGGFYASATASGVAVSNTALVGGAAAAAGMGLLVATTGPFGMAAVAVMFWKLHDIEDDAVHKVASMLKCHSDFKECGDGVIVPKKKKCPE